MFTMYSNTMVSAVRLDSLEIVEVPITFRDRVLGESKMNLIIALEAILLITLWGIRMRIGRRSG